MKNYSAALILLLTVSLFSCSSVERLTVDRIKNPTAASRQMIVVTSPGWDSRTGTMQSFERQQIGAPWKPVVSVMPVDFGRGGLGWGQGLQGGMLEDGPKKQEGDGRSPAGVFRLSAVFGYQSADSVRFLKMPYVPATASCQCVDDPASAYYNLIVDSLAVVRPDWHSHENMMQSDDSYKWGVVVDHNASPREANNGSCIFLHVWGGPASPTSGCTAMEESTIVSLIRWLDAEKNPVLVQLTESEYQKLRSVWNLP